MSTPDDEPDNEPGDKAADEAPGGARTVFVPGGGSPPPADPARPADARPTDAAPADSNTGEAPAPPSPRPLNLNADPAATTFAPLGRPTIQAGAAQAQTTRPPASQGAPPSSPVWDAVMPEAALYVSPPAPPTAGDAGRIAPGSVLNHIYEVRRFIARGGMGEVYEGFNVNTDEQVAIKVILPHLAMDAAVQAMFRKEARTLTRLSHPGLVQYRVLAQEPVLGVLYIVTDFIDGGQLSDYIGQFHPGADELEGLLRRLAAGLAAAHELGAIHRDISPDNVLLPGGRLDQAKIIDFGIAKDLDASSKTIVGDGFAGKLGFVAPEQFGDFDREIGPWTDVYSLALVLLSVAAGRPVDMGATLVDAIDKRRKGPDLAVVPDRLRPVFEGMLAPNPQDRFRSMKEVLDALDRTRSAGAAPTAPAAGLPPPGAAPASGRAQAAKRSRAPMIAAALGGLVLVLLVVAGAAVMSGRKSPAPIAAATPSAGAVDAGAAGSEKVRRAVEAALPGVACTWLDIDDVSQAPDGVSLRLSGVAGSPVGAQQAIQHAAEATGVKLGLVDTSNVFPVASSTCAPLNAFRGFRAPTSEQGRLITSQQSNWELMAKNPPCAGPNAKVVVDIKTGGPSQNFTVLGFDRKGGLQQIFTDRAALESVKAQSPELVTDKGGGDYSTTSCYNETGLVGEALVTGAGPFDVDLPNAMQSDKSKQVDPAWIAAFIAKARAGGWKTSMVWYRVVNDQPG